MSEQCGDCGNYNQYSTECAIWLEERQPKDKACEDGFTSKETAPEPKHEPGSVRDLRDNASHQNMIDALNKKLDNALTNLEDGIEDYESNGRMRGCGTLDIRRLEAAAALIRKWQEAT